MVSSSTWIMSLKVVLISAGVLTVALTLKAFVPLALEFSVYGAPLLWSSLLSWLKPPYLYFVINCIVILIVASSRFHHKGHDEEEYASGIDRTGEILPVNPPPKMISSLDMHPSFAYESNGGSLGFGFIESAEVVYAEKKDNESRDLKIVEEEKEVKSVVVVSDTSVEDCGDGDEFVISKSTWTPPRRMDFSDFPSENLSPAEKPLVTTRFGHRRPIKTTPEAGGRSLRRVTKPKRHETMENTWKTITEGRPMPLTRHLKKLDSSENHIGQGSVSPAKSPAVKFRDRTNNYQQQPLTPSPVRLKKEASLSQDDLNRRVEAFIKKFNEEMRLQRQQSLNQYKQMVTPGI